METSRESLQRKSVVTRICQSHPLLMLGRKPISLAPSRKCQPRLSLKAGEGAGDTWGGSDKPQQQGASVCKGPRAPRSLVAKK